MKIQISNEEVITAKLMSTLLLIDGLLVEAKDAKESNQNYHANSVSSRISKIKDSLLKDIKKLAADIVPDNDDVTEVS